jgi:hypothetical protein
VVEREVEQPIGGVRGKRERERERDTHTQRRREVK